MDNSHDELFPNMDKDIKSLLLSKFKDSHVRAKLLEDILTSMKLIIGNIGDSTNISIYYYDIVKNQAKLLVEGISIHKIVNTQFEMLQ